MGLMKRKPYPSDLTDEQWAILLPHLPVPAKRGAPRRVDLREIVNALLYLNRSGCQWRMLPHDFPDWQAVYDYFRDWRDDGTLKRLNDVLRIQLRLKEGKEGKEAEPSAAILDSQTVKVSGMSAADASGYDAGKKITGVKRHALVDTKGWLLALLILHAGVQDPAGARQLFARLHGQLPRLQKIWADGIYTGTLVTWVSALFGWVLEIVKRTDKTPGFVPLPRRWVIERFFGWLNWSRRLSKHYERRADSGEAMVYL